MADVQESTELWLFGPFTIDFQSKSVSKNGVEVEVEPKGFQILEMLLRHHGRVVTYDQFSNHLWPGVNVEVKKNINTQVNKLRRALGESARNPTYVLTQPNEGYCFNRNVPVERA